MQIIGAQQQSIDRSCCKDLLSKVDQFDAFQNIVGYRPIIGNFYKSLFREDKDGRCRYVIYNGDLRFIDNAGYKGKISFNLYDVVMELYSCSYEEACTIILNKTNYKPSFEKQKTRKEYPLLIRFKNKFWTDDVDFIQDYKLDANYMNNQPYYLVTDYWYTQKYSPEFVKNNLYNPDVFTTIAYYFAETLNTKLYWYKGDKEHYLKFYTNCINDDLFGIHRLGEYDVNQPLFIVKSGKEDIILNYHLGLNTLGVQAETNDYSDFFLSIIEMFPEIYIIYDNDDTGKKYSFLRRDQLRKRFPKKLIYSLVPPNPLSDLGEVFEKAFNLNEVFDLMFKHKK